MRLNLDPVRKLVKDLATDECVITRAGRSEDEIDANWNETTGTYDPVRVTTGLIYEGPCSVYRRGLSPASSLEEGGEQLTERQVFVSLPWDQSLDIYILPEDEVEIIDVGPDSDETLIGMKFLVNSTDQGTYMASREIALRQIEPKVT